MENQHQHIKGYRDLSQAEIDVMNRCKAMAEEVGRLTEDVKALQKGFMALVRAIARPTTF